MKKKEAAATNPPEDKPLTTENPPEPPNDIAPPPAPVDMVPRSELDHILKDLHKLKEDKRKADEAVIREKEDALKANQRWEEFAKLKEQEAEEWKGRYTGLSQATIQAEKMGAIRTAAIRAGILDHSLEDLELLDFPEVRVETTSTGRVIVHGVDVAVSNLKQRRPNWFNTKPLSVNPASPEAKPSANGKVTLEMIEKLEKDFKKDPSSRETRQALHEAILKYKQQ